MFIDRDGTLNEEREFLTDPGDLRLIDGAGPAVRVLNRAGITTCVISNQSGVARGYLTEETLGRIHDRLVRELEAEGARIDGIYYCPHHPDAGAAPYRKNCDCRKPKPGMLLQAAGDFGLDLGRSFVVGDKLDDIRAGQAVSARTILVLTGYGSQSNTEAARHGVTADHVAPSIREAVDYIIQSC
ncbi:MAG: HAD-IIIA family hydrolase [Ignavibacteria bacterium]|nr:HAD-IIIA family hydrolase [Ignavibacteria bacterium]